MFLCMRGCSGSGVGEMELERNNGVIVGVEMEWVGVLSLGWGMGGLDGVGSDS